MNGLTFLYPAMIALLMCGGCSRKSTGPGGDEDFQIEWEKTIGGMRGYYLQNDPGGGFIVAGVTTSGAGCVDYYLAKIDELGDTVWTRSYGGYLEDWCRCAQPTSDGGYILAGYSDSFDPYNFDIYLVKTDDDGDILWTRTYGGASSDYAYSVRQVHDGGYIVSGATYSFGAGERDIYLIRIDENGDTVWTRTVGGDKVDEGYSVVESNDHCYVVAGRTTSFGAGDVDAILAKVDSAGNEVWRKTYGGEYAEVVNEIQHTSDGGYIMVGGRAGYGSGYYDFYLVRVDADGILLWSKAYGDSMTNYGLSVQETDDGYIMAGSGESRNPDLSLDVYVVKTSSDGSQVSSGNIGHEGDEIGYSIRETQDGCYLISGYTTSLGTGGEEVYLLKIVP